MKEDFVFNFNAPIGEHIDKVEQMKVNITIENKKED